MQAQAADALEGSLEAYQPLLMGAETSLVPHARGAPWLARCGMDPLPIRTAPAT